MVVSKGQRVLPAKAQKAGFQFEFSDVGSAMSNLLA